MGVGKNLELLGVVNNCSLRQENRNKPEWLSNLRSPASCSMTTGDSHLPEPCEKVAT